MVFRKISVVHSENFTKYKNIFCGQNAATKCESKRYVQSVI